MATASRKRRLTNIPKGKQMMSSYFQDDESGQVLVEEKQSALEILSVGAQVCGP
jgi:hypothetical protein